MSGGINMKISDDVLSVFDNIEVEGNIARLNCGQLDRKIYLAVNQVLEAIGGKWNRKVKGHIFEADPTDKIESIILTGDIELPKKNGYFPTPLGIVNKLIELANIEPGMRVLEPSAGQGAIADELAKTGTTLEVCEILPQNIEVLMTKGYTLTAEDFLSLGKSDGQYDRIVMNPPFEKQQDIDHVMHAYSLLRPGGILVAIMSAGVIFRENKKTVAMRELIERSGMLEELPEGSFKDSGTMVRTVVVKITA